VTIAIAYNSNALGSKRLSCSTTRPRRARKSARPTVLSARAPSITAVRRARTMRSSADAVVAAGFIGFGLGATPTPMVNMTAVTQGHGPRPSRSYRTARRSFFYRRRECACDALVHGRSL